MKDDSEKNYREAFKRYQQDGLERLSFIDLYRLYCNAEYYYVGDDADGFKTEAEKTLLRRIDTAGNDEVVEMFASIDATRTELFSFELFELIVKAKRYATLDDDSMEAMLKRGLLPFHRILESENVVKKFEALIRTHLLSMATGITFWIDKYDCGSKYHLPKCTNEEIASMIRNYIHSKDRNPSELGLLAAHKNSNQSYTINADLREEIRLAYDESFSDPNIVVVKGEQTTWETGIDDGLEQPFYRGFKDGHMKIVTSKSYLDERPAPEQLIEILRDGLQVFDENICISGVYNPLFESGLTLIFEHRTQGQYGGEDFRNHEQLRARHFWAVADYLARKGFSIESRLEDVVSRIKGKNGLAAGFRIKLFPDNPPISRAEGVFNEIESLAKQYFLLRKYGRISDGLYRDTQFPGIENLESFAAKSYFELCDSSIAVLTLRVLFLEKPHFKTNGQYVESPYCFIETMKRKKFRREDLSSIDQHWVDTLVQRGLFKIDTDGFVAVSDPKEIGILGTLSARLFFPTSLIRPEFLESANSLVEKGIGTFTNGLFSKYEAEYLNYYLTDKKPRAASLRNKYEHGASFTVSEEEAALDYYVGLRILCCLAYKIKNELENSV